MKFVPWFLYKAAHQNKVNVTWWLIKDIAFLMRNGYRLKMENEQVFAVKEL